LQRVDELAYFDVLHAWMPQSLGSFDIVPVDGANSGFADISSTLQVTDNSPNRALGQAQIVGNLSPGYLLPGRKVSEHGAMAGNKGPGFGQMTSPLYVLATNLYFTPWVHRNQGWY
jgi:hypothetical protein